MKIVRKIMALVLTVFFVAAMVGVSHAAYYANSHDYTPGGQPPRYCPPGPPYSPTGVHPDYALGEHDDQGAGWGKETGELILGFECPLKNVVGDDLTIWHVGKGTPKIWVSTQSEDPHEWYELGNLSATGFLWGTDTFEFGGLDSIYYVRVEEYQSGSGSCHFIDAVAGAQCVPIPGAALLLGSGLAGLFGLRRRMF